MEVYHLAGFGGKEYMQKEEQGGIKGLINRFFDG